MSKYIIDIPDGVEWGVVTCRTEGGFYTKDFDSLEELNSDYINDHFGGLQDDAYHRGLSEGNDIGYKDGVKDGRNEAWEAVRKIVEMTDPPYWGVFNEYKEDLFGKITASEAIVKLKTYEENQNDKFEFGDEIIDVDGVKGCVVSKNNEEYDTMYVLFNGCRVPQYVTKSYYRKTGRHFDIDKILEEMKE